MSKPAEAPRTIYLLADGTYASERESAHDVEYLRGDWVWEMVKDWQPAKREPCKTQEERLP